MPNKDATDSTDFTDDPELSACKPQSCFGNMTEPTATQKIERNRSMKSEEFKNIILYAIEGEIEAYNYYRTVSEKVADAALKSIFGDLAGDEKGHRAFLEGILKKGPSALNVEEGHDYKIAETLEFPPLSIDLKPIDGITLAIRKELDAMQMYTQLSLIASDSEEKKMFLELAKMERGHKARLEDIYTTMAFPEVW
jgi:rubrerythrin